MKPLTGLGATKVMGEEDPDPASSPEPPSY